MIPRLKMSYTALAAVIALYFTVALNLAFFSALSDAVSQSPDGASTGFLISVPIFLFAVLNLLFQLFSWPKLTKPFFVVLILVSSMVSYAGYNYGTIFDREMIRNIVETDSNEATSYLSLNSTLWFFFLGVVPSLLLMMTRITRGTWGRFLLKKLGGILISLALITLVAAVYFQNYASFGRNNRYLRTYLVPTQFVYSLSGYLSREYFTSPMPYQALAADASQLPVAVEQAKEKPTLMVFVVGETARAKNYELNGYEKATNPYTRKLNVISFRNVYSCGTATAVSVPCMFSALPRTSYDHDVAQHQDGLIDALKQAGVSLLWKDNDSGDKGVARNIPKVTVDRKRQDDMCNGKSCYDMALLENLDQEIAQMKGNRMITLHLMGSLGPTYFERYPKSFAVFKPECERADIEHCSVDQIVNTYDNTLLYTDYVTAEVIKKLQALEPEYNTVLLYISDHGESLGENGIFLHGLPYSLAPDEQKHVPMILWTSAGFDKAKQLDRQCMLQNAQQKNYSQDNIFHSMIGIMDVTTNMYDPALDLFRDCRGK